MEGESPTQASTSAGAVFLSYASQDAEAAKRICEALRAGGIEVWFDQSELRGGDAWDRKIRDQIHDCRLFIPVISANTERRDEGYFRREWTLAAERTRDMAHKRTFLVPVVIDGTAERGASVPDKFHELQWTRLPGGETPPAFAERVKRLLAPEASHAATLAAAASTSESATTQSVRRASLPKTVMWGVGAIAAIALAYVIGHRFWLSKRALPLTPPAVPATQQTTPVASVDKSVAVLPFVDMSEKHDQEYFTDGLTEELINRLAQAENLKVIARTSSFQFKGRNDDVRTIATRLGVAHVLEGSVRKFGANLRVTVQLIRAADGSHQWSQTYDRRLQDALKVQDDIASAVARALFASFEPRGRPAPEMNPTYALYLQAQAAERRATSPNDFERVVKMLEEVVRQAPDLAIAWAQLSHIRLGRYLWDPDVRLRDTVRTPSAREADTALRLDPQLAEGHLAKARVLMFMDWDWTRAEQEIHGALELGPQSAVIARNAYYLSTILGQWDEAFEHAKRAAELDPLAWNNFQKLADAQQLLGRFTDAEDSLRIAMKLAPDTLDENQSDLGWLLWNQGRHEEAIAEIERQKDPVQRSTDEACMQYLRGRRSEADKALAEVLPAVGPKSPSTIGGIYACRGDLNNAFNWLKRALSEHDPGMVYSLSGTRNPTLKALVADPRFKKLLQEMKLPE